MNQVVAYTKAGQLFPGYVNLTTASDGSITVILRGDPKTRKGAHVCGFAADKGKHGRCTPGDECCNNYCNMAPQKGAMQPSPEPCEVVECGATVSLTLTAEEWSIIKAQIE